MIECDEKLLEFKDHINNISKNEFNKLVIEMDEKYRSIYTKTRELRDHILSAGVSSCKNLSMGMSRDFEMAIEEGATHIRIGTALFGARS